MRAPTAFQLPPVKYSVTRLGALTTAAGNTSPGGLDQTTPSLSLQPGALRDCVNFECNQSGGYSRIEGYERIDGQTSPTLASYRIVQVSSFVNVPTVGQTITQAVSGATGVIIAIVNQVDSYYMAVTQAVGTFDFTHVITTPGPVIVGTAIDVTVAISSLLNAQYTAFAADAYRALIGAVPGSGAILGVVGMVFSGVDNVYAFRADVAGTSVKLYKTSAAGWSLVPFFNTVDFTIGGTAVPLDNDTLTQGAVTATIKRVMWQSGSWTGGSAVGTFVVGTPTGGHFSAGTATTTSGATVTLSGAETAITLLPGGHFEFVKCNFSGQLLTRRIYGCDGVNKCFEFDGTTLCPITTGLTTDAPSHIVFHKNFLFISQASSIFYCAVGSPYKWNALDGAGEIATGDVVTGMSPLPGGETTGTLAILQRHNTSFLYGLDPTTFNYVSFNVGIGAIPYSIQNLFDMFVFDDLGVITLKTTLGWGNFLPNTLTKNIQPFIVQNRASVIASSLARNKSQYRVFFSNGYGLWLTTVNQQFVGSSIILFPNPVFCCDEGETSSGEEVTYFGSSDGLGYVYQLDKGTSFDGENIDAYITLAWDPIKSPRILKRFRAASVEMQSSFYAQVNFGYQLGYGSALIGQPSPVSYASGFASTPVWDQFTWDSFIWDGQTLLPTEIDMTGTGENIQVSISSSTNYIAAYNINSIIYHWTPRRGIRV